MIESKVLDENKLKPEEWLGSLLQLVWIAVAVAVALALAAAGS